MRTFCAYPMHYNCTYAKALPINFSTDVHFCMIIVYFCITCMTTLLNNTTIATDTGIVSYSLIEGLPDITIVKEAESIGQTWINGTVWEQSLIQKFYELLPKDVPIVVLDIGAQTGAFSLMAKYLPYSTWYAFEPIHEAAHVLQQNLILNDIHNVIVHQTAVADFNGTAKLTMPHKEQWGLATIGPNILRFSPQGTREVACIDLDTFVALHNIKKVDFIKMDTEGAEFLILRGGYQMLMRDHPIILMEYYEKNMQQCNVHKDDIHAFLEILGYSWQLVSNADILCIPLKC